MMMEWNILVEKYRLRERVKGVLHCGAHLAEEAPSYTQLGVPVWWIEANPALIIRISEVLHPYWPQQKLINSLLGPTDGEQITLNITGPYEGSSSVLEFGTHPEFSPETKMVSKVTLPSRTIDSLVKEHGIEANMLVMDLQGFEGPVLKGASELLPKIDFVMSEINRKEVYKGCTRVETLDALLAGFERVETHWVGDQGWGDALYRRK